MFRFLMVAGALLSHVLGYFYTWDALAEQPQLYLHLFTRGAAPGLLVLFGFMLEFVYVRYAQRRGLGYSVKRMCYRALLCYLASALIAAAGMLGGHTSVRDLISNLVLISASLNADIFLTYFYVLFAIIPVIALRLHFGIGLLPVVMAGIWLVDVAVLQPVESSFSGATGIANFLGKFLLGLGGSWGPSIFHGLTAVLFGVGLGNFFATRARAATLSLVCLVGTALVILGAEIYAVGWNGFLAGIADYEVYRGHNSVVYYAYGAVHAMIMILLARGISGFFPQVVQKPATYLGSRTFLFFLFGNMILSAVPRGYVNTNVWLSAGGFVVLVTICYAVILLWEAKFDGWQPVVTVRKQMLNVSEAITNVLRRFSPTH